MLNCNIALFYSYIRISINNSTPDCCPTLFNTTTTDNIPNIPIYTQHNTTRRKSCIKAYELLGHINEKEQDYHEAAENYQKAWIMSNEQNSRIGYRLAVCYMKSRHFIEAIDICERLLDLLPETEVKLIKKETLDKCKLYVI